MATTPEAAAPCLEIDVSDLAPGRVRVVHRGGQRRVVGVVGRVQKEWGAVPVARRVGGDPVQSRAIAVVGPHLHHVAGIDHECAGHRRHVVPVTVTINLQPAYIVLQQHGQCARVGVMMHTHVCFG